MVGNLTAERGFCTPPFLELSSFDSTVGYLPGRFCAPVPSLNGTINCCLPCPITSWVYSDEFNEVPKVSNWITVAGMACCLLILFTYLILPVKQTHRHYLTIGLIAAICFLQLGIIIPLAAKPEQCHDAITPNDMYSDRTCAFSGAFLLFGGFAAIIWGFLRSLSIHLQICWQVVPGSKFFWTSVLAGWGIPAIFVAITLPLTGTSYRFSATCHINHQKALGDYWGPLLAFAAISTILQFATFGYCIKVYIKSLFAADTNSTSQVSSSGLPEYNSRAGSVKTVTAGQAYRRIKKVIALQWRGTAIVLIILINVVFLSIVFIQMDNTVTAAMQDLSKAEPWLLCLVINQGNKNACLNQVKDAGLVTNEATVMAVLILLSLNGIWVLLFLGRTSMLLGWFELIRPFFTRKPAEFVSVDARRYSNGTNKNYEMIISPPTRHSSLPPKEPEPVITTPLPSQQKPNGDGLSPLGESPQSDYFSKEIEYKPSPNFGKDAQYRSPKWSFSTPRPPSAGGAFTRSRENSMNFSQRMDGRAWSPGRDSPNSFSGRPATAPAQRDSGTRSFTPTYEWDPLSTHAKSSRRQEPYGF